MSSLRRGVDSCSIDGPCRARGDWGMFGDLSRFGVDDENLGFGGSILIVVR